MADPRGITLVIHYSLVKLPDGGYKPRLADDFGRALAIAGVGRAQHLRLDDLGETDDRVQWRLELVDQLAKRLRVGSCHGLRQGSRRRPAAFADRNPAVADEAAAASGRLRRDPATAGAGDPAERPVLFGDRQP